MANCVASYHGKDYVPIRAIPDMTADLIPAEEVPKLLACRDPYFSASAFEVKEAALHPIDAATWRIHERKLAALAAAGASREESIAALPAGVVVLLGELEASYEACFVDPYVPDRTFEEAESLPSDFLDAPLASPFMSGALHEVVMQGVGGSVHVSPPVSPVQQRPQTRKKTDYNPELQERANDCADKHHDTHGKWPSKAWVAEELAKRDKCTGRESSYRRQIRNEWNQKS